MSGPDYSQLLDPEVQAFVARTEAFYSDVSADASWPELRAGYDRMCADFNAGRPASVEVKDKRVGGVPLRIYTPPTPKAATLLFLHGGGFVMGGLETHDDVCAELALKTGLRTVAVDYRLAPDAPLPAALDDCLAAGEALSEVYPEGIVLAGDSAGGCLAAALSAAWQEEGPRVFGQVLIYPGLGWSRDTGSAIEHAKAPLLTRQDLGDYAALLPEDPTDRTRMTPLSASDFSGLPLSVAISVECDPLRDDSRAYTDALKATGCEALSLNVPGLVHGSLRARHMSTRAAEMFEIIADCITTLADQNATFADVREICAARTF